MRGWTGERRKPRASLALGVVFSIIAASLTACAPEGPTRAHGAVSQGEASLPPLTLSAETSGSPSPGDRSDTVVTVESGPADVGLRLDVPPPSADDKGPSPAFLEAARPGFAPRVERPPQQA